MFTKYPAHTVFTDVCSGSNFKHKSLETLLEFASAGRLRVVCIAHRDRICRFAYDLLDCIFEKHGAKIIVEAYQSGILPTTSSPSSRSLAPAFTGVGTGESSGRVKKKKDGAGAGVLRDKESAGGEPGVSDSLSKDVSDHSAGGGASTLLCGGEMVV